MPDRLSAFQRLNVFLILLLVTVPVALSGCSYMGLGDDVETISIWGSRDQFVRIEPQDLVRGKAPPPNDQPVDISPDRISGALGQILVKAAPKAKANRLFADHDLRILGDNLSKGLAEAGPNQDVSFAIQTWGTGLLGLREPKIVTGRVFYVNKQLNVIFGSIFRDGPAFEGSGELTARNPDIRLNPYVPGLRSFSLKQTAILSTPRGSGVFRPAGSSRIDWLVFGPQALVTRAPALSVEGQVKQQDSEYKRLREELEQMKRQMQTPQGAYPQGAYPQQGYPQQGYPPAGQAAPGADTRSLDQRLSTLDKLKERGLISEAEYQAKRQEILQGF